MNIKYADSYIDRLFSESDLYTIYSVITAVEKQKSLSDEFWLFCRVFEWAPSRSGVWQYYEGVNSNEFHRLQQLMRQFRLIEIAEKHLKGKQEWKDSEKMSELDNWLYDNEDSIHESVFKLIEVKKDELKQ